MSLTEVKCFTTARGTYLAEQDDMRRALLESGATRDEVKAALIEHALRNGARLTVETYGWYAQWTDASTERAHSL